MSFPLRELPFDVSALEPDISAETVRCHHDIYQSRRVDALNALTEGDAAGAPLVNMPLLEVVLNAREGTLFENASEIWNHEFYWSSLTPGGGGSPAGELGQALVDEIGSLDSLRDAVVTAAAALRGSGWVWLLVDRDRLRVATTHNADNPLTEGHKPVLAIDVWEHAYYLDYRDRRDEYVRNVIDHLANWRFAEESYRRITGRGT